MNDFLYWPGDRLDSTGSSRGNSPFWTAIQQVKGDSETLRIACPYLAPSYIKEFVENVDVWRLVTDVQAWTRVYGGEKETTIRDFISTHENHIRHYPGLHTKTVIGDESAVFGSANLTQNGMVERQEMGLRVTVPEQVADLHEWFEMLWGAGQKLEEGVLPSIRNSTDVRTRDQQDAVGVFERLGNAPSRDWVESLLDLMEDSTQMARLGEADPRLVTSIAQDDRIMVTVNSRYVCGGFFDGVPRVGFILADGFTGVDEAVKQSVGREYYRFSTRDGRDPHWVEFDQHPENVLPAEIRPAWETTIENEVNRKSRSQYLGHHDERVYRLIVDDEYREGVLEDLF